MSNKTNKNELFHPSSPDYRYPVNGESRKRESIFTKWMDKARDAHGKLREKKIGRKAVMAVVAAGALVGGERAISASIDDARQEIAQVNEKFEPVLKPVAEQVAKDAIDKYTQSQAEKWPDAKGNGYILENTQDPSKLDIAFNGFLKDGSAYSITATVGENTEGKPDVSKVEHAEVRKSAPDNLQTSIITLGLNEDTLVGGSYWGASSTLATKGMDPMAYTSYYNGSYQNLDEKVAVAKDIAKDASGQLSEIEQLGNQ